jgi:hypothetical protein
MQTDDGENYVSSTHYAHALQFHPQGRTGLNGRTVNLPDALRPTLHSPNQEERAVFDPIVASAADRRVFFLC